MDDRNAPATKGDIADLSADLRETREQLRSEMKDTTVQLRSEMKDTTVQLRSEMKDTTVQLRSEMKDTTAQLRSEMKEMGEQLSSEMHHIYDDVVERMADSETRLLKAFYTYAESNNQRVAAVEGNEASLRIRVGTLEDRVLQLEKRLNMPPAA